MKHYVTKLFSQNSTSPIARLFKTSALFIAAVTVTLGISMAIQVGAATVFQTLGVGIQVANDTSLGSSDNVIWGYAPGGTGSLLKLQAPAGTDKFVVGADGLVTAASGYTPTANKHFVTKDYVDTTISAAGGSGGSQTFTSSGNWTAPSGVYSVNALVIGAGGGGGGGACSFSSTYGGSGGGGGASGVAIRATNYAVEPDQTYSVVVGAGGGGGAAGVSSGFSFVGYGSDGSNGGNSQFDKIVAAGGRPGTRGGPGSSTVGSGGAAGGNSSFPADYVSAAGGNGSPADDFSAFDGADLFASQGGDGSQYNGDDQKGGSGGGGAAGYDGDGGRGGNVYAGLTPTGGVGYGAGGGGGSGANINSCPGTYGAGGAGAGGIVILYW